jgi:hypothetical protein
VSAPVSSFRGYHAIGEVIARMTTLADWLKANRPEVCTITLRRRDLDLLQRWPKAAALYAIFTVDGVTSWRGFTLRADRTGPRYEKPWLKTLKTVSGSAS